MAELNLGQDFTPDEGVIRKPVGEPEEPEEPKEPEVKEPEVE